MNIFLLIMSLAIVAGLYLSALIWVGVKILDSDFGPLYLPVMFVCLVLPVAIYFGVFS